MEKENRTEVEIEEVIAVVQNKFGDIAEIDVHHPTTGGEMGNIIVGVSTSEVTSVEQHLEDFSGDIAMTIQIGESESKCGPVDVIATGYGPGSIENADSTVVYREDADGTVLCSVEEGVGRVRDKLSGCCPVCQKDADELHEHYMESDDCRMKDYSRLHG